MALGDGRSAVRCGLPMGESMVPGWPDRRRTVGPVARWSRPGLHVHHGRAVGASGPVEAEITRLKCWSRRQLFTRRQRRSPVDLRTVGKGPIEAAAYRHVAASARATGARERRSMG